MPPADVPLASDAGAPAKLRVIEIGTAGSRRCALLSNSRVRCWGHVDRGADTVAASPIELPVRDVVDIAMPGSFGGELVVVTKDGVAARVRSDPPYETSTLTTKVRHFHLGSAERAVVLHDDGTVAQLHWNFDRRDLAAEEKPVANLGEVTQVYGRNMLTCGIRASGTVGCVSSTKAYDVPGLTDASHFAEGHGSETCAIRRGGGVRCWNDEGQPGASYPVDVVGIASTYVGGGCEATRAGEVRCTFTDRPRWFPASVTLPAPPTQLAVDNDGACALLATGNVMCWGGNQLGLLGDGTLADRVAPTAVLGLLDEPLPSVRDGMDAVPESDVTMDWSGVPGKCGKHPTELWDHRQLFGLEVVSAYAWRDNERLVIRLANYRQPPSDAYLPPRGRQKTLQLAVPAKVGRVRSDDLAVYLRNGVRGWSPWGVKDYNVKITHLDATWVCGTYAMASDMGRSSDQRFAARLVPMGDR